MVTRVLLDTNILIEELRRSGEDTVWSSLTKKRLTCTICPITLTELWAGESMETPTGVKSVDHLLRHVSILPISRKTYRDAGVLLRTYRDLYIADALIAAVAIHARLPLVTLNKRHFQSMTGLTLY
jgi:predicted nucleic acid-binding protein